MGSDFLKNYAVEACRDQVIEDMVFFNDTLHIAFNSKTLSFTNDYASYCAVKYLVCDDELEFAKGAEFIGVVYKEGKVDDSQGQSHETAFADIITSKGVVQLAAHNEHNGYYGGIDFVIELKDATTA